MNKTELKLLTEKMIKKVFKVTPLTREEKTKESYRFAASDGILFDIRRLVDGIIVAEAHKPFRRLNDKTFTVFFTYYGMEYV